MFLENQHIPTDFILKGDKFYEWKIELHHALFLSTNELSFVSISAISEIPKRSIQRQSEEQKFSQWENRLLTIFPLAITNLLELAQVSTSLFAILTG
jgi:hypothetical protein